MPRHLNPSKNADSDPKHSVVEWSELDDKTLLDSFKREKQQQLLVEPLYSSRSLEIPFIAAAGVGIFYDGEQVPLMPDAFLSLGVETPSYWSQKQHRHYSVREFSKVPDVCIEQAKVSFIYRPVRWADLWWRDEPQPDLMNIVSV